MNLFISEISKYIMLVFLAIYTVESYMTLRYDVNDRRTGIYLRQSLCIYVIHTLGMLCVYAASENMDYLVLYFVQFIILFIFGRLAVLIYEKINRQIINHIKLLLCIGFIAQSRLSFAKSRRQLIIVTVSMLVFLILPVLISRLKLLKNKYAIAGYGFIGALLLAVVYGWGGNSYGSKLFIKIFGLAFQPSEFVKLFFIFFLAGLLYKVYHMGRVVVSGLLAAVFVLILVASKDLGAALIYCVIYLGMIYIATGKHRYLISGIVIGAIAGIAAYYLFAHVRVRVDIWQDPWSDIDNTGYQLAQSLFGIAMGGWFGRGIGRGIPEAIPFVDEDFIFSAITEEMGVIFGVLLLLVCLNVILHFLNIAQRVGDPFYRLVAAGIGISYGIQVFLTVGGGSRLIPLTGVTLPLISNGGSSVMATLLMFGVMAGIAMIRQENALKAAVNEEEDIALYEEGEQNTEEQKLDKEIKIMTEMNRGRNIFFAGTIFAALFLLMAGNLIYFMVGQRETVINNSYNYKRQEALARENSRGTIYASDGTVLAEMIIQPDGMERRNYPYGDVFAHVIGYASNGRAGIEQSANMYLLNSSIAIADRLNNQLTGQKNPGDCIYTTLDPKLQQIAYDSLGVYHGAVIVTEAQTGRILAMVSKPDYDPNEIELIWDDLINDEDSSVLVNRATQGLYPPGSTFKIFTALEYIRQNPDTYLQYRYQCNGYLRNGDAEIHCYHGTVHGSVDFITSFAKSCNSSFANIGIGLNRQEFAATLLSLRFNSELPIDMAYNQSHISMREDMTDGEVMQTAIGQSETLITPIHLNMVTQAIANYGEMMTPYVIDRVESVDGNLVREFSPVSCGTVMTEAEAAYLTQMMIEVVENGTATKLSGQNYTAAGKTGSAEYSDDKNGRSHAWFTGFAPAENPEIVVTVILEAAGTGGDYSAPIARRIFSGYFAE